MNSSGLRMEPCGTPARIGAQSECWPLITTLWYLSLRKLRNMIGMIWDLYHISGKTPDFRQFLYISDRGLANTESHIFNICVKILS